MSEISDDWEWVKALPDHALEQILDSLYDVCGHALRRSVQEERFKRHSTPITEWPKQDWELEGRHDVPEGHQQIGLIYLCGEYPRSQVKVRLSRTPDDPDHQPVAMRLDGKWNKEVLCSCGKRQGLLDMQRYRASETWWWPVEKIKGINHYVVCPHAKGPEDPHHAPSKVAFGEDEPEYTKQKPGPIIWCICGHDGYYNRDKRKLVRVP